MRKSKSARMDAKKITRPKLGRTMLRPLGLVELAHVPGASGEPETDGIWSTSVEGDGIQY